MAETGVLPPDARVELLDGEIVEMTPIGARHASAVSRLIEAFGGLLRQVTFRVRSSLRLDAHDFPEPDFVLAVLRADRFAAGTPTPSDVLLVVEVADSSLAYDREEKGPHYARHGIPEYWIVDLIQDRVEVHRRPESGAWQETSTLAPGDTLAPLAFPDHAVAVADLLP